MAKKLDSPCMFCGELPCVCDGPVKKKSPPKVKAATPKPKISSPAASTSEDVFGGIPEAVTKFKSEKVSEQRDLSLESAVRVLLASNILHPESSKKLAKSLERRYPQDLDRRKHERKKVLRGSSSLDGGDS